MLDFNVVPSSRNKIQGWGHSWQGNFRHSPTRDYLSLVSTKTRTGGMQCWTWLKHLLPCMKAGSRNGWAEIIHNTNRCAWQSNGIWLCWATAETDACKSKDWRQAWWGLLGIIPARPWRQLIRMQTNSVVYSSGLGHITHRFMWEMGLNELFVMYSCASGHHHLKKYIYKK